MDRLDPLRKHTVTSPSFMPLSVWEGSPSPSCMYSHLLPHTPVSNRSVREAACAATTEHYSQGGFKNQTKQSAACVVGGTSFLLNSQLIHDMGCGASSRAHQSPGYLQLRSLL